MYRRVARSGGSRGGSGSRSAAVLAIGDQWNDIEMLAEVGHGAAMPTAPLEVQAVARYIAPPLAEEGVARMIETLVLAGPADVRAAAARMAEEALARRARGGDSPGVSARIVRDDAAGRAEAVASLRAGGIVALPTDTVYGVAVALSTPGGVENLFHVKRRPPDKGIMLLLDDGAQAGEIGEMGPAATALATACWPGGLTVVVPRRPDVTLPAALTGGAPTIGLRVPDHDAPRALARGVGPLPTTSANVSGLAEARTADEIARPTRRGHRPHPRRRGRPRRAGLDGGGLHGRYAPGAARWRGAARSRGSHPGRGGRRPRPRSGVGGGSAGSRRPTTGPRRRPRSWEDTPGAGVVRGVARSDRKESATMTISPAERPRARVDRARSTRSSGQAMLGERRRQHDKIELIASENYTSAAVMEAQGSWLTNKYAEGLPGKRYYGGCEYVDIAERLAQERALALFPGAEHVNVQPHSGAQANMAAYFSVLEPGDRIMGMNLAHGGHLTHGMALNFSGRLYEVHAYGVRQDTERIDYDAMAAQAREVRPKLIVGGASAYPRTWDFERMAEIAADVGALLFIDMAHIAGLVAADVHPSPFPHADLVTTTTHKTLRGPRGGTVFGRRSLRAGLDAAAFPTIKNGANEGALAASIDRNVFPGTQGGPLMQVIAGKAIAFKLAAEETFRADQRRTIENAAVMAETLAAEGAGSFRAARTTTSCSSTSPRSGVTGKEAEHLLDEIGITVNKNAIPFDKPAPNTASGIRIGTPATTSRGFGPDEMRAVGRIIIEAIRRRDEPATHARLAGEVTRDREPVPGSGAARRVIRPQRRRAADPVVCRSWPHLTR